MFNGWGFFFFFFNIASVFRRTLQRNGITLLGNRHNYYLERTKILNFHTFIQLSLYYFLGDVANVMDFELRNNVLLLRSNPPVQSNKTVKSHATSNLNFFYISLLYTAFQSHDISQKKEKKNRTVVLYYFVDFCSERMKNRVAMITL